MAAAAVFVILTAAWTARSGASLLDDDRAPLTARLVGGLSLLILALVLTLTALALISAALS